MEIMKRQRDHLDRIAADRGCNREQAIDWLLAGADTASATFNPEDQAIIDRAVELGATASDLITVGAIWAAKAHITRTESPKKQNAVNVSELSDIDLERFADSKNHPEISRERVRRTIERIARWNESVTPDQSIVLSSTYIDKLRKELWRLSDGLINQISRRIIAECLEGIECDPHGLGQFQNRSIGVPSISIGVFGFRDLLDQLITDPSQLKNAGRHYAHVDGLDRAVAT